MRISDWSSDVCSSDLEHPLHHGRRSCRKGDRRLWFAHRRDAQHRQDRRGGQAPRSLLCHKLDLHAEPRLDPELGRASCRERVCQYVLLSVVAVSLKKKILYIYTYLSIFFL